MKWNKNHLWLFTREKNNHHKLVPLGGYKPSKPLEVTVSAQRFCWLRTQNIEDVSLRKYRKIGTPGETMQASDKKTIYTSMSLSVRWDRWVFGRGCVNKYSFFLLQLRPE